MRKKLKAAAADAALERVLEALKQELIDAPDEEIREAARSLGMKLEMKESAAFAGLTYPARPQLSDFFELEALRQMPRLEQSMADNARPVRVQPRGQKQRRKRPGVSRGTKPRDK